MNYKLRPETFNTREGGISVYKKADRIRVITRKKLKSVAFG
jgi:hypothetical protein